MTPLEFQGNAVVKRFFMAIETLHKQGVGMQTMCKKMRIDKRNIYKKRATQDTATVVSLGWLSQIVKQYDVSADWLLTGRGEMFI